MEEFEERMLKIDDIYERTLEEYKKENTVMLEEIAKLCTMLKKKPEENKPQPEVRFRAGYKYYPELKRFISTFVVDEKYYDRLLEIPKIKQTSYEVERPCVTLYHH